MIIGRRPLGGITLAPAPDAQLEVRRWHLEDLWVLRLVGEVDALSAPLVTEALEDIPATNPEMSVIMDLTQVTFIASVGIGALITARTAIAARQGRLMLAVPYQSRAWSMLNLTRLIEYFETALNVEQAVHALRSNMPDPAPTPAAPTREAAQPSFHGQGRL
jgi:anti-sigma B factor antagonist